MVFFKIFKFTISILFTEENTTSAAHVLNDIESTEKPEGALNVARSLISFEAVLTGLVYLSFGIFLFKMIQKSLDAKKTDELLSLIQGFQGRKMSDNLMEFTNTIIPNLESVSVYNLTYFILYH